MKKFVDKWQIGQIHIIPALMGLLLIAMLVVGLAPILLDVSTVMTLEEAQGIYSALGYTAYASPAGNFYVNNLFPNSDSTYDIGASGNEFAEGYFDALIVSGTNPITLVGSARSWVEFRPDLDPTKLAVNAKPTIIERGVAIGYSLPVGGADEELFYSICVPGRWDGESNIHVHIQAWLDTAQNEVADAIKLSLNWTQVGEGDVVPDTSNNITDEVATGIVAQYTTMEFSFDIDYDIVPADPIVADDVIFFRLTRVASSHEIAGELVVYHAGVIFRFDKYGNPTP